MRPTRPTTPAERKVIRWFFGALAVVAVCVIAYAWWSRSAECVASCRASGAPGGELRFNAGSRLNIGTHCECTGVTTPAAMR